MTDLEPIVGIDLGTTYSAVARVDRFGRPVIVPNADGYPTTPSAVWFYEPDRYVVGEEALKMAALEPHNVVQFIKRNMGDDRFRLEFHGQAWTPTEISALILKKLRQDASEALGQPVDKAVITVPAYFNSAQRQATAQAGRLAGLEVLSILNEPTAAAIAYGLDRLGGRRRLLVFDLGGGTFDVTVMEIRGPQLRTLATDGNAELGGKDFDDLLVGFVAERFVEEFGADPRDDPQSFQELRERCVAAKIALSSKPRTVVPVNHAGHRTVVRITREEFAALAAPILTECAETCNIALEKAGLGWNEVDDLLLVGGSSRMPMVRQLVRSLAGRREVELGNPDECVALGAALAAVFRHQRDHPALQIHRSELARAASRAREVLNRQPVHPRHRDLPEVRIQDAASHPLGAVVLDRTGATRVVNLIPEGCPLPAERRQRFRYPAPGTTAVRLDVTEGAGNRPEEVAVIGRVTLADLPPRSPDTRLEVVYRYGIDQILEVDLVDLETSASTTARLDIRGSLSEDSLSDARRRIQKANVN